MPNVPASRPQIKEMEALKLLSGFTASQYKVKILGIRGYYKRTMGDPSKNDRGIYDDAICIVAPGFFRTYNANTDPTYYRPGIAVLKAPGMYLYKVGLHGISGPNPYKALRQYGRVTVVRDGVGECTDTAKSPFWIDIHKGGYNVTSSLGCQTIYPTQWQEFIWNVEKQMKANDQPVVPYCLIEF